MSTKYFRPFGIVNYRFGDNEAPVYFDNISQYVDLVDQLKDQISFYNKYTIVSGERPDTLSYELYGTTDYYWTFFLMNDHVREQGWPIPDYDLVSMAKSKYPHQTVVTQENIASSFPVGTVVTGTVSGTVGTILKRNLDLGQLVIQTVGNNNFGDNGDNEFITYTDEEGSSYLCRIYTQSPQYLSTHHFEDTSGNWVDIDPFDQENLGATIIPVTHLERAERANENLKEIIVLKPDVIDKVVSEFIKYQKTG